MNLYCAHTVLTPPAAQPTVSTAGAGVEAWLAQCRIGPSRWRLICDWLFNKRQLGLQRCFLWAASLILHFSFDTQKRSQVQIQANSTASRYRSVLTTLRARDPQLYNGKTRRIKYVLNILSKHFCKLALHQNLFCSLGTVV